jgi:3-hydroxyisobutyrate dehydrogenase
MAKLAFLGLGVMGYPMAGHLKAAGHEVTVYNRTTAKAEAWAASMAAPSRHPARGRAGAEFVMACVGNDDDLRSVVLGEDGALAGMAEGAIFVDHTTVSAIVTRELAEVAGARASAGSTRRSPAVRRGRRTASLSSCAAGRRSFRRRRAR